MTKSTISMAFSNTNLAGYHLALKDSILNKPNMIDNVSNLDTNKSSSLKLHALSQDLQEGLDRLLHQTTQQGEGSWPARPTTHSST